MYMTAETTVATSIRIADEKSAYDAACKRVLAEKIILAWVMKYCLVEFRDCDVNEIAEKLIAGTPLVGEVPIAPDETNQPLRLPHTGVEDKTLTEGTITYDIQFNAQTPTSGEMIRLIINVEAQNDFYPGYPLIKRALYYCGRMISAQYGTEFTKAHYENLKKVYSIWICTDPPRNRENTIIRYHIREENLVGHVRENKQNYDLMSVIMVCLGRPESENYNGILKLLGTLLSPTIAYRDKQKILENEFDIPMTEISEEVSGMCNLSDGVERRAIVKSIKNLMETMNWTSEQAMDALKIPESEREKYIEMLKQ